MAAMEIELATGAMSSRIEMTSCCLYIPRTYMRPITRAGKMYRATSPSSDTLAALAPMIAATTARPSMTRSTTRRSQAKPGPSSSHSAVSRGRGRARTRSAAASSSLGSVRWTGWTFISPVSKAESESAGCTSLIPHAHLLQGHRYRLAITRALCLLSAKLARSMSVQAPGCVCPGLILRLTSRQATQSCAQEDESAGDEHGECEVHPGERQEVGARAVGRVRHGHRGR